MKKNTYLLILATTVLSLVFGIFNESKALLLWSLLSVGIGVYLISLLNTKHSVMIALIFISFQGFFKVVSNYHPIVHLGADIIVFTLLLKTILQKFFNKLEEDIDLPPLTILFIIHFGWVLICLFNPYSIGFLPSLAGSKVYTSMLILYFFGYYITRSLKDVHLFFRLFIVLTMIHTLFAFAQGFLGPSSVLWIHPRYGVQLAKYAGTAFRPFGLTHVPGAPSSFIFPSLSFFMYFLLTSRSHIEKFVLMLFLPLIGQTLLFCQVRSAIIKGLFGILSFVFLFFTSKIKLGVEKKLYGFTLVGMGALVTLVSLPHIMDMSVESLESNQQAFDRSLTAFEYDKMSVARKNTIERLIIYAQSVPFGAGFSRVGASAGAFKKENAADPFFPDITFFGDNFFITLLIELGIPGLIIMSILIFLILLKGLSYWQTEERQPLIGAQLAILAALASIFIGSYGSEGIIYNPESAFFWFFAGMLVRLGNFDFPVEGEGIEA